MNWETEGNCRFLIVLPSLLLSHRTGKDKRLNDEPLFCSRFAQTTMLVYCPRTKTLLTDKELTRQFRGGNMTSQARLDDFDGNSCCCPLLFCW